MPESTIDLPVTFLDIALPDGLTLNVNLVDGSLWGVVTEPGEYKISVVFYRLGLKPLKKESGTASLLVLPNPKLMWKNIPSSADSPYWSPDEKNSLIKTAGYTITAASKRGRSHAHVGSFRDDDYAIASSGAWVVCVVADGAGSAKYSRKGAQLACESISSSIIRQLSNNSHIGSTLPFNIVGIKHEISTVIQESLAGAVGEIRAECLARQEECDVKDFSTTALIGITRQYENSYLVAGYSIGDGAIGIYQKEVAEIKLMSCADSGEYAGQTRFLDAVAISEGEVLKRTRVELVTEITALMMMTDGVSDPYFETESQLSDIKHWDALWENLECAGIIESTDGDKRLLQWLDFWSKGNHDDRTLLVITRE